MSFIKVLPRGGLLLNHRVQSLLVGRWSIYKPPQKQDYLIYYTKNAS